MKKFFWMLCILVYSISVEAQEPLSLAQAISIGLKSNFDVQIELLNLDIDRNNNNWGQAGLFPTVSFSSNQNNNIVQRKPANPFAVPGRNISNNVNGALDVQFTLFDGFSVKMTKRQLEQIERLSYGNATFVMESTIQSIMLAYYQALLEKERLRILETNMVFSKERYDYVKLRKELGGAITFDVLQEQNNYLTDSANVLRQSIVLRNSVRELNLLLNEDLNRTYTLVDSLEYQHENYQFEDLHAKMVRSNTNLKNQYINQEIIRYNTKLAQSSRYPLVTLNLGANGSLDQLNANFNAETGNVIRQPIGFVDDASQTPVVNDVNERVRMPLTLQGNSYGAYGNFGLRFTLFNGGQIRRTIENSQVREKIADLNTDQLKLLLERDLLGDFDLYNLRNQLVGIAKTKFEAALLNLDLANERYRNGALSAIDLRIVQENARNAALESYQAIFNSISTKINLIRITGGLIDSSQLPD
ncbi:MAG: TolC family protein [Cyclobacteriaceae bacterium]